MKPLALTCCSEDMAASVISAENIQNLCRMIRNVSESIVYQQAFVGSVSVCKAVPGDLSL